MLDPNAKLWIDGRVVLAGEATVGATDHGITVGDGAFETLQVVEGVPFAATRHLARLDTTLAALGVPAPDHRLLRSAMSEVVEANNASTGRLRLTVTAGPGPLGSGAAFGMPTVIVAIEPLGPRPVAAAVTVPWTRNERGALAGLKTTSYGENVRALASAKARGASEALFANTRGQLCEGTGTNVFVRVGDDYLTPPLSSGCLAGVTRALVLEHCGGREAELPFEILHEAEEVLLVSSTRNIQPLSRVDERNLGGPSVETKRLVDGFADLLGANLDP